MTKAHDEVSALTAGRVDHAVVLLPLNFGGRRLRRGDRITRDELMSMPRANFEALVHRHFISLRLDDGKDASHV